MNDDYLDDDEDETAAEALRRYFDLVDDYIDTLTPTDTAARWQNVLDAAGIDADADDDAYPTEFDDASNQHDQTSAPHLDDSGRTSRVSDARRYARQIIIDARSKADTIIAAARRVASQQTDQAIAQAGQTLADAQHAAQQITAPASAPPIAPQETRPTPPTGNHTIGRDWTEALTDLGTLTTLPTTELIDILDRYARRMTYALTADPFTTNAGHEVGVGLVRLGIKHPEALGCTIELISAHLSRHRDPALDTTWRITELTAALATGYTRALRHDILNQQAALHTAVRSAANQVELSLRASEATYRHLALYDPLTGLPNRTMLTDRIQLASSRIAPGGHIGICLLDLAGFKQVNDTHGTAIGDQTLVGIAQRLAPLANHDDYLLARLGSDEFAILIEDCAGTQHMIDLAERMLDIVIAPVTIDGQTFKLAAHVGIVDAPANLIAAGQLLTWAGIARQQAKATRQNWTVFNNRPITRGDTDHSNGPTAHITMDPSEYELAFHPIRSLSDTTLQGFEARAYWHHPYLQQLSPMQLLDLTGDASLLMPLITNLLTRACQHAAGWREESGHDVYASITLPIRHLIYPDVLSRIRDVLQASGLPAHRLQIGITETAASYRASETYTILSTLAGLGIRLAIDNFGTGLTSLRYLRNLPWNVLKLTPALSSNDATATDDRILHNLIDIAHALNLSVTAQGVNTHHQAARLAALHCDTAEGQHIGTAIPAPRVRPNTATPSITDIRGSANQDSSTHIPTP